MVGSRRPVVDVGVVAAAAAAVRSDSIVRRAEKDWGCTAVRRWAVRVVGAGVMAVEAAGRCQRKTQEAGHTRSSVVHAILEVDDRNGGSDQRLLTGADARWNRIGSGRHSEESTSGSEANQHIRADGSPVEHNSTDAVCCVSCSPPSAATVRKESHSAGCAWPQECFAVRGPSIRDTSLSAVGCVVAQDRWWVGSSSVPPDVSERSS